MTAKRRDLWDTGKCCPKLAHRGGFILRVEVTVEKKLGQEFGLVAGRIEVQPRPFYNGVDNALTAVADECDGILAATFQGEDQRGCGHSDDDAKRDGQCNAYREHAMPRRCFLAAIGPNLRRRRAT